MAKKKISLSEQETQMIERLRSRPALSKRFEAILDLSESEQGAVKTADEIEALLLEEIRRLGHPTMEQWAVGAEKRIGKEYQESHPGATTQKKRLNWWCVFGRIEIEERIWRTATSSYEGVFAPRIAVSNRGRSKPLDRVLSDFGAEHSFAKAAQQCKEHYGFEIPPSAARAATLEQAERARLKLEAQYKEPFRLLPARGSEHVVAEADGTMICTVEPGKRKAKRPRSWREMRLVAAQAHGCSQSFYAATFGKVEELGRRWAHCAKSAGWGLESQIHVVADGAEWIRLQSREVFSDQEHFLCDFYPVSQYLADASKSCRAQSPERWRKTQQKRLKNGAATKVIQELAQHIEPPGTPEQEAPVFCAHRDMNNRGDAFDYPRALKHQLPIGSGLIESGHRHVLQARLKAAGTSWLPGNAERMAQLRVLRANHQWESLWN